MISIVGDLLIGSGKIWQDAVNDDYNPDIFGNYFKILKQSDLTFANFEGIISKDGKPRSKNLPENFSLHTNPAIIKFLNNFDNLIISFANNHSADFGYDAIKETIKYLNKTKIGYVGIGNNSQEAFKPLIKEISGMQIAFIAFTDLLPKQYYASSTSAGIAELTLENLKREILLAKQSADFVVVSLHTAQNISEPFSFWPDSHQKLFYRSAVDYGADLVIGQHQHGLQWFEKYHRKLIFYSLGTFLYDPSVSKRYSPKDPLFLATQFNGGGILTLKICRDGVRSFNLIPTKVIYSNKGLNVAPASFLTNLIIKLMIWRLF